MRSSTYTYQGGHRLDLACLTTQFIARATRESLEHHEFKPIRQVSTHSWTVETTAERLAEDLRRARRFAPAYPSYVVVATGAPLLVTDRVFVRFHHETTTSNAHEFAARFGLHVVERLSPRDFLLRVPPSRDVVELVRRLTESEVTEVELIDHDLNIRPHLQELAAEPFPATTYTEQWQFWSKVDDDLLVRSCALLDCEGAWELNGHGDANVVIGVVDSGCDLADPNFEAGKFADWAVLLDGELLSSANFDPGAEDIMDPPRIHGTLCATLAAASINDIVGVGVAPNCRLLPVKWQELGAARTFPQSLFSKVVTFLRDKVDVVSNSWTRGANGYWPPYLCDTLRDAALNGGRSGRGMIWVWAAGNKNCPIRYHGDTQVPVVVSGNGDSLIVLESADEFRNSFAGLPGVVHVGAISSLGQRCHYSNYGEGLDLVAPSGNYHLYGRHSVTGIDVLAPLGRQGLRPFNGTSAAAPLVAGVAALVRSANPELSSCEIVSVLRRTADRTLDMNGYPSSCRLTDPNPQWDVSPVQPYSSGEFRSIGHDDGEWSPWFGFGKVNARNAVAEAMRIRQT